MKPQETPIHKRPIQVKAVTTSEFDPSIWKCNTLQECMEHTTKKFKKITVHNRQWILHFEGRNVIAGEFLI